MQQHAHKAILVRDRAHEPELIRVRAVHHRFVVHTRNHALAIAAEAVQHVRAAVATQHRVQVRHITNRTVQVLLTIVAAAPEVRHVHTVHHLQVLAQAAVTEAARHRAAVVAATAVVLHPQVREVQARIHRVALQEVLQARTHQEVRREVHLQAAAHHAADDVNSINLNPQML